MCTHSDLVGKKNSQEKYFPDQHSSPIKPLCTHINTHSQPTALKKINYTNVRIELPALLFNFTLSLRPRPTLFSWPLVFHLVGPGSIPSQVSFPGWGFFQGFSSTVRQMLGKLRPHPSPNIIGHHNHKKSFLAGDNVLWSRRALKPIYTVSSSSECSAQGQVFNASAETKAEVLPKAGLPPQTQEPGVAVLLGMNN